MQGVKLCDVTDSTIYMYKEHNVVILFVATTPYFPSFLNKGNSSRNKLTYRSENVSLHDILF